MRTAPAPSRRFRSKAAFSCVAAVAVVVLAACIPPPPVGFDAHFTWGSDHNTNTVEFHYEGTQDLDVYVQVKECPAGVTVSMAGATWATLPGPDKVVWLTPQCQNGRPYPAGPMLIIENFHGYGASILDARFQAEYPGPYPADGSHLDVALWGVKHGDPAGGPVLVGWYY